jgi:hypothetical protein
MDDVVVNDVVEQMATDKAAVTVDRGQGALHKGPAVGLEMRDIRVRVVQVRDSNCHAVSRPILSGVTGRENIPSQWWTQRYGTMYIRNTIFQPTTVDARYNP